MRVTSNRGSTWWGNYLDERLARDEIVRYVDHYNGHRPHQALMNFTPTYVHQVNNKTVLLQEERKTLKTAVRERRKAYWLNRENLLPTRIRDNTRTWIRLRSSIIEQIWREGAFEGEGPEKILSQMEATSKVTH